MKKQIPINRIPRDSPGEVKEAPQATFSGVETFFHYPRGDSGQLLFQTYCASCHSLNGTKLVGPSLKGLAGSQIKVKDPASGETRSIEATAGYIRQSILEPNAQLAEGFPENIMPPIGTILTDVQLNDLVDYIVKVSTKP